MRLIDADRALEIVRDQGIAHPNAYHLTNYATLILQEAPTIDAPTVDAVEVVRCKDCRWRESFSCPLHLSLLTEHGKRLPLDDDFYSYGERSTDGESN